MINCWLCGFCFCAFLRELDDDNMLGAGLYLIAAGLNAYYMWS